MRYGIPITPLSWMMMDADGDDKNYERGDVNRFMAIYEIVINIY